MRLPALHHRRSKTFCAFVLWCVAGTAAAQEIAPLELDDRPEPLVPVRPKTEQDRNQIEALSLFAAGRTEAERGHFAAALRLYQRALQNDPTSLPILQQVIEVARSLGRKAEYQRYISMAAELDPSNVPLVCELADQLTEQNDFDGALKLYEQARQQIPKANRLAYLTLSMRIGRLQYVTEHAADAAREFAAVMSAVDSQEGKAFDASTRKLLLGDERQAYALFAEAFLEAGRLPDAELAFKKLEKLSPGPAVAAWHQAQLLAKKKEYDEALARLQVYFDAKESREDRAPYELLKDILTAQGKADQLIPRLEALRQANAWSSPLAFYLGKQYLQARQWAKAEPLYRGLVERSAKPEAYHGLVEVYRQTRQAGPLVDALSEVVEKTGGLDGLSRELKEISADEKLLGDVVRMASQRVTAGHASYGLDLSAGLLCLEAKRYDAAAQFFNAAIAARPKSTADLLLNWGLGLLTAEQYAASAQIFERGVNERVVPSDNPVFYTYLGIALEMSGKTEQALAAARKAAEIGDHSARLQSRIAWILYHAKRYDEASKAYQAIVRSFDDQFRGEEIRRTLKEARTVLSSICVHQNKVAQAEEWLEQILDEYPDDISALNDLGYLWTDQGKHLERALKMIERAVAAEPENYAYRDSLGWAYYKLGRYDEAVKELQKAASEPEVDGVVLEHLGDACLAAHRTDEARSAWRRALDALKKQGETAKVQTLEAKLRQHAEAKPPQRQAAQAAPNPAAR